MMVHHDPPYEQKRLFLCSEAMVDKGASEWKDLGSDFGTLGVCIDLTAPS